MAALVDTNVLVSRHDPRSPRKQAQAEAFLRDGIAARSLVLPHQALVEFVSVVTRPMAGESPLLTLDEAHREAEDLLSVFPVIYPTDTTFRTALRGAALYQLSWYDAHLWAYADEHGLGTIWSEDFEDGRWYGRVQVRNPFRAAVHEPPPPIDRD